jgi:hypothetical protein
MKEKVFKVNSIKDDGTIQHVASFVNNETTRYNLVSFLMTDVLHYGNLWDEKYRKMVEERFDIFVGKHGGAYVEIDEHLTYSCIEEVKKNEPE